MENKNTPSGSCSVSYHDGSGNHFQFWLDVPSGLELFSFSPVLPASSSSGTYSGGKPNSGVLAQAIVAELLRQLKLLEETAADFQPSGRLMGSGTFSCLRDGEIVRYSVPRGEYLRKFDTFVLQFKG